MGRKNQFTGPKSSRQSRFRRQGRRTYKCILQNRYTRPCSQCYTVHQVLQRLCMYKQYPYYTNSVQKPPDGAVSDKTTGSAIADANPTFLITYRRDSGLNPVIMSSLFSSRFSSINWSMASFTKSSLTDSPKTYSRQSSQSRQPSYFHHNFAKSKQRFR